jgi:hypothetical protein
MVSTIPESVAETGVRPVCPRFIRFIKPLDIIQVASGGTSSLTPGQVIMLDYHDVGAGYSSASGGGHYTLQRIFAHELGHAAMGNMDNGPGGMNNINWNENPVMRQLGDFNDRTAY